MTAVLDPIDMFRIVRTTIRAKYGNQRCFAETVGVSPQYVSDMLSGRSPITPAVLQACGLRRREVYEIIPTSDAAPSAAGEDA